MKRALSILALLLAGGIAGPATQPPETELRVLDEMDNVAPWQTVVSDGASASIHEARGIENGALVLEYDFAKTAGYLAATRTLSVDLPEDFEISFWVRGEGGRNTLEVKFLDESGDNVWWFRRPDFTAPGDWQQVRIKRRQIDFAWGPTEERTLKRFAAVEFTFTAGRDGGKGNLWFDKLSIKPIARGEKAPPPLVRASSERASNRAALALDGNTRTGWRSASQGSAADFLEIDFHETREFGGIEIDWADSYPSSYTLETSLTGQDWTVVRQVDAGNGGRDSHLLPESEARYVRISVPNAPRNMGIAEVYVRDLQFGASPTAFLQSVAKSSKKGCYPRGFIGEQLYWTIVGVDGDSDESLLSEDGPIEARRGSFSVEPFVLARNNVLTWADVGISQSLEEGYLPLPAVGWRHSDVELSVDAYTGGAAEASFTRMTYRVRNPRSGTRKLTLALAVRPLQVNPPTQFLATAGGASKITELEWRDGTVMIDRVASIIPVTAPDSFRAVPFDADSPCEWLEKTVGGEAVRDATGLASGALFYSLELEGGAQKEIVIDLPLHAKVNQARAALPARTDTRAAVAQQWREKLNRVELRLPTEAKALGDTLRSSLAYVLINRDGAALQPGSRAYERSWIRDGALTSEMLLRLGHEQAVKDFLRWYAQFQFPNGKIPCCVDRRGADPVPENDSPGEYLFLIDETFRYTKDLALLKEMWPSARRAVAYMEKLRYSERTPENLNGDKRIFFGLMPASISHEGYSAKPMHSYWDNFWALAGYEAAVRMARTLEDREEMRRLIAARDEFRTDLYRSLELALERHKINYLPGAAELGDFDATSTTIALSPVGEQQLLPPEQLLATFERYWRNFEARKTDKTWDAYTPYEWRVLGTFVRFGRRDRVQAIVDYFMRDRRPAAWNHWAEVVGREPRTPRFIGDMPHGWVASDFGRSFLDMLAYERPADEALVLMAGVPKNWVQSEGLAVRNLRTPYGRLSYSVTVNARETVVEIGEITLPPNGIVIAWPDAPPRGQSIQQGLGRWMGSELRVTGVPFRMVFPRGTGQASSSAP